MWILVTVFITCLIIGIALKVTKKATVIGSILLTILAVPVMGYLILLATLIILFSYSNVPVYSLIFLVGSVFIAAAVICFIWGVLKRKAVFIPILSGIGICAVIAISVYSYRVYVDKIPIVSEGDDILAEYAPYAENTKAVSLDEDSALIFDSVYPRMDGATALFPVYSSFAKAVFPRDLIEAMVVTHGNRKKLMDNSYLKCNTTTKAYEKIVTGEADIIFVAESSEQQKQFAEENGVELVYTPIGKEAFVFFVNSKNPINDISLEDVQKIYSGEITKWSELGVRGLGDIKAFQRDEGSGSQSALIKIMQGKELITPPQEEIVDGMGGIIKEVANYKNFKNAIGFSFRFYSTEMVKNDQIKLLSINGIEPTIENIENGTYPIHSYFYAVTRSDANENTKRLVEWITGPQGQEIIERVGYTPILEY